MSIPKLVQQGSKTILMVKDQPYIMLAGEVHNSDSSSPAYMEQIWKTADDLGMNTLLLPVSWEMVEPVEGNFEFTVVRDLILQARRYGKKIVFLWFGSWKNAEMMYTPEWVKRDTARFTRAEIEKGKKKGGRQVMPGIPYKMPYYSISYLCEEAMEADANAFAKLMAFIRDFDEEENTVVAVQVENETGLLGNAREQSDAADAAFAGPVPQDFADYMKAHTDTMVEDVKMAVEAGAASGTWTEVFGPVAEEIFSAYYVSKFVEYVAAAGKAEYPLPFSVNCWLDKGGAPGSYPTGGPVSRVHEVWNYNAPSIGILSPDIYVRNFTEICDEYVRRGKPLFIPEAATHSYAQPRMVYTIGHHHAICYSPFGFDDIGKPFSATQSFLFGVDVTDPALSTPQNAEEYGRTGKLLQKMIPLIGSRLGTADLDAVCAESGETSVNDMVGESTSARMIFNPLLLNVGFKSRMQPRNDGYCLAVKTSENELYLLANACSLNFISLDPIRHNFDLMLCQEGTFDEKGAWVPGRWLNGDETANLSIAQPTILKIRYNIYGD